MSITGIRGFTLAYPGWDCVFEVHVNEVVNGNRRSPTWVLGCFLTLARQERANAQLKDPKEHERPMAFDCYL